MGSGLTWGRPRFLADTGSGTEEQAQQGSSVRGNSLSVDLNEDSGLSSGRRRVRVDTCSVSDEQMQQGPSEERHVDEDETTPSVVLAEWRQARQQRQGGLAARRPRSLAVRTDLTGEMPDSSI